MVWDGVCSTARTDLHVFPRGTMNSTVYVTDILEQYVVPFVEDNFIFQHDNTRPHSIIIVSDIIIVSEYLSTKAVLLLCNSQQGVRTLTR
jgi:hypothetical protein